MCDFMTYLRSKKGRSKNTQPQAKNKFHIKKKTNKTETWYKKQLRKKNVGIKANQPKTEKETLPLHRQ